MGIIEPKGYLNIVLYIVNTPTSLWLSGLFVIDFSLSIQFPMKVKLLLIRGIFYINLCSFLHIGTYRKAAVFINHKRFVESQLLSHNCLWIFL